MGIREAVWWVLRSDIPERASSSTWRWQSKRRRLHRAPTWGSRGGHLGESTHTQLLPAQHPGRRALAQLAAVRDHNLLGRLPILGAKRFYFFHNIHALFDVAKHNMFAIQPVCLYGANEELGAIGVGTCVCHGQDAWPHVFQCEVLVRKAASVDGLPPCAIMVGEVASLQAQSSLSGRHPQLAGGFYRSTGGGAPTHQRPTLLEALQAKRSQNIQNKA